MSSSSPVAYRPDIDGLRAVAVLSVVGYHAFPAYMSCGLIGVDIFFVISGFLISSIILRSLQMRRFSYAEFYGRRIKRIFPALIVVLGACLSFGWFFLYDLEFAPLGKHVAGGAAFIANILLWKDAGYFAPASVFNELLHLWSLGVEEQFYFLWPLLLAAAWPFKRAVPIAIALVLVGSFALNLALVATQPTATFYLPFTRFWELMLGAALAYAQGPWLQQVQENPVSRELLCWSGVVCLALALVLVDHLSPYPGSLALLPTLCAFCLIAAGPQASVNRRLLSWAPVVLVGLISYPLYLWHWPLLSFATVLDPAAPSRELRAALVVAALVLAWLTYRYVEHPIRATQGHRVAVPLAAIAAVLAALGLYVYLGDGLASRGVNARVQPERRLLLASLEQDQALRKGRLKTTHCDDIEMGATARHFCESFGRQDAPRIVLWGDSHSWAWAPAFYQLAHEHDLRIINFSIGGCPPLVGARRADAQAGVTSCATFGVGEEVVRAILAAQPRQLFIIGYWGLYTPAGAIESSEASEAQRTGPARFESRLLATLRSFPGTLPITLFRTQPVMLDTIERGLLRKVRIEPTAQELQREEGAANAAIDRALAARPGTTVFDPTRRTCDAICHVMLDGTLLYFDKGHISAPGALLFREEIFRDFLAAK